MNFYVFSTVHRSIGLFLQPNLMHNSITHVCHITILDMFRALTCPFSGGTTAQTQHLVSSLSLSWCYLPCSACFVVPDCCVVLVQFCLGVLILVNRFCLFGITQFDVFSTVHHSIGLFLQPTWLNMPLRARIPDAVFVQVFFLRMGMSRPETCRG